MTEETTKNVRIGIFRKLCDLYVDTFINDKMIMKSINEKGLTTSSGLGVIKVIYCISN